MRQIFCDWHRGFDSAVGQISPFFIDSRRRRQYGVAPWTREIPQRKSVSSATFSGPFAPEVRAFRGTSYWLGVSAGARRRDRRPGERRANAEALSNTRRRRQRFLISTTTTKTTTASSTAGTTESLARRTGALVTAWTRTTWYLRSGLYLSSLMGGSVVRGNPVPQTNNYSHA